LYELYYLILMSEQQARVLAIDRAFLNDIIRLGGTGIQRCYQCGTCTAICPLSEEYGIIPSRKVIKYVQLGLKERATSTIAPWLCFQCGDCTDKCPKEADPSEILMALRRYTIQRFSWGRIASVFYSKVGLTVAYIVLSAFLALLMYFFHGKLALDRVDIYSFISYDTIHWAGLIVGVFVALSAIANVIIMYLSFKRGLPATSTASASAGSWVKGILASFFIDTLTQIKLFRCGGGLRSATARYIAHLSLFWGFAGLFLTTAFGHFIPDLLGIEVPWIYPRVSGIIFGLVLLYGTCYFIYKRLKGDEPFVKYSYFTDWAFLVLMLGTCVTGFITTLFLHLGMPMETYIAYAIHLIFLFDLLVTAPFTKFMHAIYRPFAIAIFRAYGGATEII